MKQFIRKNERWIFAVLIALVIGCILLVVVQ